MGIFYVKKENDSAYKKPEWGRDVKTTGKGR
jgi:hypothetical protein